VTDALAHDHQTRLEDRARSSSSDDNYDNYPQGERQLPEVNDNYRNER